MPYQSDNRGSGPPPISQHHSMRLPSDRSGMVGMRSSPPHVHPPNVVIPSYSRHDYHHQPPPRHLPPHFNERPGRSFVGYSPPHPVTHRQADEHMAQFPVARRGPTHSPRTDTASGPEGSQHIHAPPSNVRRSSQFPYAQGFYDYSDYNRGYLTGTSPGTGTHSPSMRRPNTAMREGGEVVHRFVSRPMQGSDHPFMMASEARHMSHKHIGPADQPHRHPENWRRAESFESDYVPNRRSPQDEHNLPSHPMQKSPQYRTSSPERGFRGPQNMRVGHPFEQGNARHMSFDRSPHKSDHTDDDNSRSHDENSSAGKDDISHNLGCTCKKSKCLKLYCQCFASSAVCVATCRCISCKNVPKYDLERNEAIHSIIMRNPNAFDTKFKATAEGKSSKVTHKLGCKCRKSACLKKYCECYHAEVKCSANCRCTGCQNMPSNGPNGASVRQNNYVPGCMIDAARDLAGLKSGPSSKVSATTQQPESPARPVAGNQDLYPVPSLTTSSKEEEVFTDDHHQPQNRGKAGGSPNPCKHECPTEKESSPVDILLSAAYALTELGAAHTPVTPNHINKTALISPSPKRKMSDVSYHSTPSTLHLMNENSQTNVYSLPKKRNRTMITPAATNIEEPYCMNINKPGFREIEG